MASARALSWQLAVINLPAWSRFNLAKHFRKHGRSLGCPTIVDYETSSLATITNGARFTYEDAGTPRIGYYEKVTNLLTVVSDDGLAIITHFAPTRGEQYCRDRPQSTYV
jgi:hypothetical protein